MLTHSSIPCTSAAFAELSAAILCSGKALRFQARGNSMQPLLRDGDLLLVQPVDATSIRIGDVVLCNDQPGRVVVHRVLRRRAGMDGDSFLVQGDQVAQPDGLIPAARVYGRVVAIDRGGMHIDVNRPGMRVLSRLAVVRSRWNVGRGKQLRLTRWLVKRLPVLSRYLT